MASSSKQPKGKEKIKAPEQTPSVNWLALQKACIKNTKTTSKPPPRKRRKLESTRSDAGSEAGSSVRDDVSSTGFPRGRDTQSLQLSAGASTSKTVISNSRESLEHLRNMVLGQLEYTEEQKQPGKYLAIDCEMVGVGPEGSESSLARVSLVNYHGAIILDEFVRQRERVVDYRTHVSGVRAEDMINGTPIPISFQEIQKRVASLLKDRILVGHAINNDLKALLLSHPRPLIRDTQLYAGKARLLKSKYPALRKLTQQELGVTIQAGEHSSVTDARATMALYRLHRKEWDKNFRPVANITSSKSLGKRKVHAEDDDDDDEQADANTESSPTSSSKSKKSRKNAKPETFPGGGRRGISSGLSTVVKVTGGVNIKKQKRKGEIFARVKTSESKGTKDNWWTTLDGVASSSERGKDFKDSMRIL
ncbi:ribonuclease H-like protein [Fomitiporia mediterranea MF3/22]|uniref:ribonuclease H-like protein n=1 Tax=Fomitiporia mediterranea (strain MF3/22) TaxID=694068 RepID=UPI0004407C5F|nr:ribonuclease H-like protein [Fomitiporia mediterranea MF3/22]EJD08249.1 ribonuclease H-like protein [Fomitiporia mediterranea MF3/22]